MNEAVVTGTVKINGFSTVLGVMDARFFIGSMGHNVGEKITRAVERATEKKLPIILFTCSGGARIAGGNDFSDADGKNISGVEAAQRCRSSLIIVLTDPDYRRRNCQLCYAGRYYFG